MVRPRPCLRLAHRDVTLALESEVDRGAQLVARDRQRRSRLGAGRIFGGVDRHAVDAGGALQVRLVLGLEAGLADGRARRDALVRRGSKLAVRGRRRPGDLTNLTEDDGADVALGVVAQVDLALDDAREELLALGDVVERVGRDVVLDVGRRIPGRRDRKVVDGRLDLLPADPENARQPPVQDAALRARGRQVVGDDRHLGRDAIAREQAALAVEDVAAWRRDRDVARHVGGRLGGVLSAGQHLQVPQPEGDDPEQHEGQDPEHADAPRELRRQRCSPLERGLDHGRESGLSPPVV